ncbi:MAG: hypothetical protein R2991_11320 [Thermoanaerobaculia bacterium]
MKQPSDEELILHYYGEAPHPEEIEEALERPEVAARWRRLREVLDAVPRDGAVPERPAGYGAAVWRSVRGRIDREARDGGRLLRFPTLSPGGWRWAAAAGVIALMGLSFWVGGIWRQASLGEPLAENEPPRVLLLAVSEHLDRTEMLLAELVNRDAGEGGIEVEREWAEELTTASRFYRQAAERSGEPEVAWVLSEIEPVLVELAHAPEEISADELAELRSQLERDDMLFKIRVVGSRLKHETLTGAGGADV